MIGHCPRCGYVPPATVHLERVIANRFSEPVCGSRKQYARLTDDPAKVTCGRCLRTGAYEDALR